MILVFLSLCITSIANLLADPDALLASRAGGGPIGPRACVF